MSGPASAALIAGAADMALSIARTGAPDHSDSGLEPGKTDDAFRSIGEAAVELNLPAHVLRYWETQFSALQPLKRSGGRRYYRPADIAFLKLLRGLLHEQGYTIRGVQKLLEGESGSGAVAAALSPAARRSSPAPKPLAAGILTPLELQAAIVDAARSGSFGAVVEHNEDAGHALGGLEYRARLQSALDRLLAAKRRLDALRRA